MDIGRLSCEECSTAVLYTGDHSLDLHMFGPMLSVTVRWPLHDSSHRNALPAFDAQGAQLQPASVPDLFDQDRAYQKILRSLSDASPGSRAWPGRHRDKAIGARLDWGEKSLRPDGRTMCTLVMQANKGAAHKELRKMAGRDSHRKILTLEIDVDAPPDEEQFISEWSKQVTDLQGGKGEPGTGGEQNGQRKGDDKKGSSKKGGRKRGSGRK